jgi:hypothetical protein
VQSKPVASVSLATGSWVLLLGEAAMGWMPAIKKVGFEIIVLLLIFGYSADYYFEVAALPSRKINLLLIQPVFFIITIATIALIFFKIREALNGTSSSEAPSAGEDTIEAKLNQPLMGKPDRAFLKNGLAFGVCTLVYVLLLDRLGFVSSSFLYLSTLIFLLGSRSFWITIVLPLLVVGFLYVTMALMLRFSLPQGWLI